MDAVSESRLFAVGQEFVALFLSQLHLVGKEFDNITDTNLSFCRTLQDRPH